MTRRPSILKQLAPFLLCALAAAGFRAALVVEKAGYLHDEQISVLTSTCGQLRWTEERADNVGRWIPARKLKAYTARPESLCLTEIAETLARADLHPPLYFWLLHVAYLSLGVGPWVGPALNACLAFFTALLLGALFTRVASERTALLAVGLWAVASGPVYVSYQARQYELLTLLTVALFFIDGASLGPRVRIGAVASIILLGGLTHFHFALAPLALFVSRLLRRQWKDAFLLGLAGGLALFALFLIHPGTIQSLENIPTRPNERTFDPFGRLEVAARNVLGFFFHQRVLSRLLPDGAFLGTILVMGGAFATTIALRRRAPRSEEAGAGAEAARLRMAVILFAGSVLVPYLLGLTFYHTLRDHRYLGPFYPFVALALAAALRTLPARLGTAAATGLLLVASLATVATIGLSRSRHRPLEGVRDADRIVIASIKRGFFVGSLLAVDDDDQVFWAKSSELVRASGWLDPIENPSQLVYAAGGDDLSDRAELFKMIERRFAGTRMTRVGLAYFILEVPAAPEEIR